MLYKAKGNSGYELEVDDGKFFIKSEHDSQRNSYPIDRVSVEDFKKSIGDNGSIKIVAVEGESTTEYLVPFSDNQQRNMFLVANCITFSKFRPKEWNPSFAIGIGGSLEITDNKLLISRESNQLICPWAKEHRSIELNFTDIREIGFYAVGMLRNDIVPEAGNIGCIRLTLENQEHMLWNPLTDENTILFDESMEVSFYRLFRLVKKLTGSPTPRIKEGNLRYFSNSVIGNMKEYLDKHQNTVFMTKSEIDKPKDIYLEDVSKLACQDYVSKDEAYMLQKSYPNELRLVGILSSMKKIKDKEYEELLGSYRRGLIFGEEWNSLELDFLRGYSKNQAFERMKAKENINVKVNQEKLIEQEPLAETLDEELTEPIAKTTKTTHSRGKLIHFPTRRG